MLLVVESVRKKQLAWLRAILEHKGVKASRAAKEAGVNPGTLNKFLGDPLNAARLNTYTIEKLEKYGGIPPFETGPVDVPRGFEEGEATPYDAAPGSPMAAAIAAIKGGRNGVDPWILNSRALEHAGYFPGDVLMIDLNRTAEDGDIVVAQIYDRVGRAETVMRIYEHPYLIAATSDKDLMRPALVDNKTVQIRGVMTLRLSDRRAA